MFSNFFVTAWRNALRHRAYTLINIVGLSIGLTCCLVLMIFGRYETSFDQYHQYTSQTFRVVQQFKMPEQTLYWNTTAYPLAEALRNDFSEFAMVTQASGPDFRPFSVTRPDGALERFEEKVLFVDNEYPKVFDLKWLAGDSHTALSQPQSIVITARVAEKCFGPLTDPAVILGKTIVLNKDPLLITGVIEDAPGNSSLQYHMLVPYEFFRRNNPYPTGNWSGNYQGTTFVVLKEGVNVRDIEAQISGWQKKYLKPEDDARIVYQLQPLKSMHNDDTYGSAPGSYAMPMRNIHAAYAIALFVLIIASVNFVNLATAQASSRAKEVGVRKVMGSTRWVLIRQFMMENTLLILVTLIFSIGFTTLALDVLNDKLQIIHLTLRFEASYVMLAAAVGMLVIALAAVYPAVALSGFRPAEILKNRIQLSDGKGGSLRRPLIVLQFVVVQVFVIATVIVARQMHYMQSADMGFESESIIKIPVADTEHAAALKQRLLLLDGIEDVTFGSGPPQMVDGQGLGTSFRQPGQEVTEGQESEMKGIDTNYLAFYNIPLIAGRNISTPKWPFDEFVINERAARAMGWSPEEAVGRKLAINEGEATVVGVVQDFHNNALQNQISPCIMINWSAFQGQAFVKLRKGVDHTSNTLGAIEETWQTIFPEKIYRYSFLTDSMQREYTLENLVLNGFFIFSVLSVLIGAMGLLGMISFMTARKTKEVGIRKVLGASVQQIILLFSKEFIWLVGIAFIIASPLVYLGMSQWLADFAYRISLSWWMFALGGGLALLIAMTTIFFQSARAAIANPVNSLRSE